MKMSYNRNSSSIVDENKFYHPYNLLHVEKNINSKLVESVQIKNLYCNDESMDIFVREERFRSAKPLLPNVIIPIGPHGKSFSFYNEIIDDPKPDWLINTKGVAPKLERLFQNKFPIDERINLDMQYILSYRYKTNLVWYHLSVPFSKWDTFRQEYTKTKDTIHILPYSHICIYGEEHHRHLVAVSTREIYFGSQIKKDILNMPYRMRGLNFAKKCNTTHALIKIFKYLSRPSVTYCKFNCHNERTLRKRDNFHLIIFKWLPKNFHLIATALLPNGTNEFNGSQFMHNNNKNSNKNVSINIGDIRWCAITRLTNKTLKAQQIFPLPKQYCLRYLGQLEHFRADERDITAAAAGAAANGDDNNEKKKSSLPESFLFIHKHVFTCEVDESLTNLSQIAWNKKQIQRGNCLVLNAQNQIFPVNLMAKNIVTRRPMLRQFVMNQ